MKYRFLFFVVLLAFLLSINACDFFGGYSQSYVIVVNKKRVGKEIINERTDIKGNLVCLSEQEMDTPASKEKKRIIIRTKTVFRDENLFPVSYSYESSAGTSYDVKVEDGQIIRTLKKEEGPQVTQTPLEPGMLMLDLTVFYTIDYWIRNYDVTRGGQQVLQTYLLPAASIRQLSIIPAQIFIPEHETKALRLKNYEIDIGHGITMLLWVDKDNRLYRLFIRGPDIDVIRSDLFDKLASKENDSKQKRP
jgi:hypothetical protein